MTKSLNLILGLLSSAGVIESGGINIWRMSVANGSKQSWYEFLGQAQVYDQAGGNVKISTCGSVLVIVLSRDLSLPHQ